MHRIPAGVSYFFILGLFAIGLFGYLGANDDCGGGGGNNGCNNGNTTGSTSTGKSAPITTHLTSVAITTTSPHAYQPGETVELRLSANWDSGMATFSWTPPAGAANFNFPGPEPDPGGPPFVFSNVNPDAGWTGILVSYSAPSPASLDVTTFSDALSVSTASGDSQSSVAYHNYVTAQALGAGLSPAQPGAGQPASTQDSVSLWHVTRYVDVYDTPMNTAVCQQYVKLGQSSDMFVAMQAPVSDQVLADTSYKLPVIETASQPITLTITGPGKTFTMPSEVRIDSTAWANQHLPAAAGQLWVAVAPDHKATITCPADFNIAASTWSMMLDLWLDLHDRPNACENCALTTYACYRQQSSTGSALLNWLARPFDPQAATVPAVADGITCLGPNAIPLVSTSAWSFEAFTLSKNVLPGDALDLHYWITNSSGASRTFSLASASDLSGAAWKLYEGQSANPDLVDLSKPITSPVTLTNNSFFHIHVLSTVPAGASSGVYTYSLTAANASLTPSSWKGSTTLAVGKLTLPAEPVPGVSISMEANPSQLSAGSLLTYTLKVTNSGQKLLHTLVISDTIPAHTHYSACSGADSCALASGKVTWNLANLDTGQVVILALQVTVDAGTAKGTVITNSAYGVQTLEGATASGAALTRIVGARFIFLPTLKKAGP